MAHRGSVGFRIPEVENPMDKKMEIRFMQGLVENYQHYGPRFLA